MSRIYLFNPWNDLALANFSDNYTPPASSVRMAEELALLPIWYAEADNTELLVVAEGERNRSFLESVSQLLPLNASIIPFSNIGLYLNYALVPWGWSPSLRKRLLSAGVGAQSLPSSHDLLRLRDYSGRRHAVELLAELKAEEPHFYGESHFYTTVEELFQYLSSVSGDKVLKMPLSGSGKGLIRILGGITDKQRDWCRRVSVEQGGVVAEPLLTRVQDFAMEFYLHEGEVRFVGYSLFGTTASGAYTGNELISNSRIEEKLMRYIPGSLLRKLQEMLKVKLPSRFPHYTGYAGVDMMVCDTPQGCRLHPCVEINMRMNMGVVARLFYERYMLPDSQGQFVVDYFKKPGGALEFHEKMQEEHPLKVKDGKILYGFLPLTPVYATTQYMAFVLLSF